MKAVFHLAMLAMSLLLLGGCEEDKVIAGYMPASAISKDGFARDRDGALKMRGQQVKLWGYVDGSNVFPIGGDDNRPGHWQFHLKAKTGDKAGGSFAVHVPVDDGHDELVALFEANDRIDKPTRVFVTGTLSTFDTRGNFNRRTGLELKVATSGHVQTQAPAGR